MKIKSGKTRVKGFTLVEMIVVIAIITALLGIMTPAMMSYIRRSRISAANADAKLVYNAAQTEVQKYIAQDRVLEADQRIFANNVKWWIGYEKGGAMKALSNDGSTPAGLGLVSDLTDAHQQQFCMDIIGNVNSVVSGASDVCWAVYVDNYIVKGCVSAEQMNSRYIGYYTASQLAIGKDGRRQESVESQTYQNSYLGVLGKRINTYNGVSNS